MSRSLSILMAIIAASLMSGPLIAFFGPEQFKIFVMGCLFAGTVMQAIGRLSEMSFWVIFILASSAFQTSLAWGATLLIFLFVLIESGVIKIKLTK